MATVLVVSDLPVDRRMMVATLRYSGHRLLQASTAPMALRLAQAEHPELVIIDLETPGTDDPEFVRRIHSESSADRTPVIGLLPEGREAELRSLAESWGLSGTLSKPLDRAQVLGMVEQAIGTPKPPLPLLGRQWFDREHRRWLTDILSDKVNALETMNRKLVLVSGLGRELTAEVDEQRLLKKVCQAGRDIIGARYAGAGVFNEGSQTIRAYCAQGLDVQAAGSITPFLPRQGALARVLAENRACRLAKLEEQPQVLGLPAKHPPVRSFLGAPISGPGPTRGWLYLADRLGTGEFSEEEERLLVQLADQAGMACENLRLTTEVQDRVTELEQQLAWQFQAPAGRRENEGYLKAAMDSDLEDVHIVGPEGNLMAISQGSLVMAEADVPDSGNAEPVYLLSNPEQQAKFRALADHVFGGRQSSLEFETIGSKGSRRWLETHAVPLRNERDETVAMLRVTRDITDRKQKEKRLLFQSQVLEGLGEGLGATDIKGNVIYCNPTFEAHFGYGPGELLGKPVSELIHGSGGETAPGIGAVMETLKSDGAWCGILVRRLKDGTSQPAGVRARTSKVAGKSCWVWVVEAATQPSACESLTR